MNRVEALLDFAKSHVPFHRRRAPTEHLVLEHWPLMDMDDVNRHSPDRSSELLSETLDFGGYVIASGGTKQQPKYLYYAHQEAIAASANIARHFMAAGMVPGDGVINYFTSGDMWSAFLMVDKALSTLPVTIYPLGYSERMDSAINVLERFKPNTIVGIPSMILSLARYCAENSPGIRIDKVFYGGESLTAGGRELLTATWGSTLIRSAGYASTDLGSIGWQCAHCLPGEHFPFDDVVVEIVDDEIVVTSLSRYAMPMIRYRTGDSGEWAAAHCDCAAGSPMFRLKGRRDNVVIIWGCWITYGEIEKALEDLGIEATGLQLHAYTLGDRNILRIEYEPSKEESDAPDMNLLKDRVYAHCADLNRSLPRAGLDGALEALARPPGTLTRSPRTGKVIPIIDARG